MSPKSHIEFSTAQSLLVRREVTYSELWRLWLNLKLNFVLPVYTNVSSVYFGKLENWGTDITLLSGFLKLLETQKQEIVRKDYLWNWRKAIDLDRVSAINNTPVCVYVCVCACVCMILALMTAQYTQYMQCSVSHLPTRARGHWSSVSTNSFDRCQQFTCQDKQKIRKDILKNWGSIF